MKSIKPVLQNQTVVIFDGECVICNRFFRFLIKRDKRKRLKFATIQSEFVQTLIKTTFLNSPVPDSILLWGNGKLYIKSEAAIWSTASLGGIWIIVRILFIFPKFLRNMVYDFVARNRYKWFQKQSCMLPDDNFKDRFV